MLILTYHAIDSRSSVISLSTEVFRWQMEQLKARGLKGISLRSASEHLERNGEFPADSVVLTFDDGYLSVLENAVPVMERQGFNATIFLVAGMMGLNAERALATHPDFDRSLLDWNQAAALARSGFDIGSHTLSHPDLRQLSQTLLEQELAESKLVLEQRLQTPVNSVAYPYGYFNADVLSTASRYYRHACTTRLGRCDTSSAPMQLNRVDTWYLQRQKRFLELIEGGLTGWLQFRQQLRDLKSVAGHFTPGNSLAKSKENKARKQKPR